MACEFVSVRTLESAGPLLLAVIIEPTGSLPASLALGGGAGLALAAWAVGRPTPFSRGRVIVLTLVGVSAGWIPIALAVLASR